jgi:hypothetical protein
MVLLALGLAATAAERKFEFGSAKENETPTGFRSLVTGEGQPGQWKVIRAEVPAALPALYTNSPVVPQQAALAQFSHDPAEEHFPLLVFEEETFSDFTLTTRLKTVSGQVAQMAGLAFRIQDEKNYYVVRVSSTGNNVQFYKFVGGVRSVPIGPEIPVPKDVWHELSVECKGNQITIFFNGKQAMPALSDSSFSKGRIGFWTKSDSVSYFADARITYTPRERFAAVLVRDALRKYTQAHRLKLYVLAPDQKNPRVIASDSPADLGQEGGQDERACLQNGTPFFGKTKEAAIVLMPVRDRNGDVVAAAKVYLGTFFGQTEQSALNRARPLVKFMEGRVLGSNEPLQ